MIEIINEMGHVAATAGVVGSILLAGLVAWTIGRMVTPAVGPLAGLVEAWGVALAMGFSRLTSVGEDGLRALARPLSSILSLASAVIEAPRSLGEWYGGLLSEGAYADVAFCRVVTVLFSLAMAGLWVVGAASAVFGW